MTDLDQPIRRPRFVLPDTHDWTIRKLWAWGWDTQRIAAHIDVVRRRGSADEHVYEEDVYNVLDRALGRDKSGIVKAT